MSRELVVDSFAGGGGASLGIKKALGFEPDIAINHDAAAIAMHAANHKKTKHYTEDVWKVSPVKVTAGRKVGLLWASPDCKHFSRAKGSKPVEKKIRSLAWVVVKWAAEAKPRIIILENVREFEDWGPLVPRWKCLGCEWSGTEGQAKLGRRQIRNCPRCESVDIHRTDELVPDPHRKGLTFKRFAGRLRSLGYEVQWRTLDAADYGAPTHRRRLFLVARRDKKPIVWPRATHGDPKKPHRDLFGHQLKPWRTAAECIEWNLSCPSIFDRKKPLAEKTMHRIALGIKRYVLDNPEPFIVDMQRENRPRRTDEPLGTATTQDNRFNLVTPILSGVGGPERSGKPRKTDRPFGTVLPKNSSAVVTPFVAKIGQTGSNGQCTGSVDKPLGTVVSKNEHLLISPTLIQTGYGERKGQAPRSLDLNKPLGTAVAGGAKQALVAAFLAQHNGGAVGAKVEKPLPTTTARGTQTQLVAANLVHLNHGGKQASGFEEPMRTAMSGGTHAALVYSFLTKYFGCGLGQVLTQPMPAAVSKDHTGLVLVHVHGEPHVIVDIGMRMLTPRELARGQGFPDSYKLTGTATNQVAKIGNSVAPAMAEHLVLANYKLRTKKK